MASSYLLKKIPKDVFKFVQKEQSVIKEEKGTNSFSFESTIYKMLRDYKKCREENNFKPSEE